MEEDFQKVFDELYEFQLELTPERSSNAIEESILENPASKSKGFLRNTPRKLIRKRIEVQLEEAKVADQHKLFAPKSLDSQNFGIPQKHLPPETNLDHMADLNEYKVFFPFEPYDVQRKLMKEVFKVLQGKESGLLESPTGTGKSLVALVSVLSYMLENKSQRDLKALYMSRTHSQLSQVVKELRKTAYKFSMGIMGSRDQLCVNSELDSLKGPAKKQACHLRVKNIQIKQDIDQDNTKTLCCHYYDSYTENSNGIISIWEGRIFDIEELVADGKSNGYCPYFLSKDQSEFANLVLLPYDYVTAREIRFRNTDLISRSILIIDEAHNVLEKLEDGANISISNFNIDTAINELIKICQHFKEINSHEVHSNFLKETDSLIADFVLMRETIINECKELISSEVHGSDKMMSIFRPFEKENDSLTSKSISQFLNRMSQALARCSDDPTLIVEKLSLVYEELSHLFELKRKHELSLAALSSTESPFKHFKCKSKEDKNEFQLQLMCINPEYSYKEILDLQPHSVLFLSGTLSPFKFFELELNSTIPIQFEGDSVISDSQIYARVLTSINKLEMNFSYVTRKNEELMNLVGRTLIDLLRVTPQGVLIFFQSYQSMNNITDHWKRSQQFSSMNNLKQIYIEGKDVQRDLELFKEKSKEGAIFMGVMGGKLSEGYDFTDHMARLVVLIGVPYPNIMDIKVKSKRAYLDNKRKEQRGDFLSSDEWYLGKAVRSTNQAIGRAIRHYMDFGAVVLIDKRFENVSIRKHLSKWVRSRIASTSNTIQLSQELSKFFIENEFRKDYVNKVIEVSKENTFIQSNSVSDFKPLTIEDLFGEEFSNVKEEIPETLRLQIPKTAEQLRENLMKPETNESQQLLKKINVSESPSETRGCLICFVSGGEMCAGKCGHVACLSCWTDQIAKSKCCFFCRRKITNKKQLLKLYL